MGERTANVVPGDLGLTLAKLATTIHQRRDADVQESYTAQLLNDDKDLAIKKVVEEAAELALAVKDDDHDHIRYEAADLLYHLLVVLEKTAVSLDELAGELDARSK
ncbi:MAG: phosphoribosyl-ATP diphosphatase [Coriobacteriia bacterium]|nr:phosphoribosyl-ATP diphosphatase [Coriobacteriia bacterium]